MKVLILAPFHPDALAELAKDGEVVYEPWLDTGEITDPVDLGTRLAEERFDALVIEADFVFEETLVAAPGLRFVGACRGEVGEHVDLGAAAARGVTVVNTPGRNAISVAELAIGMMLDLARRIPAADAMVHRAQWSSAVDNLTAWQGIELAGKTAGLVGCGTIGREVARRLAAFDMHVLAYDPYVEARQGGSDAVVSFVGLPDLLSRSDFVSIHAAVTDGSRGLIGARELALMKPSAYLVNTARAAIVDERALLDALCQGQIAGAGLDVHRVEPLPFNSPWLALHNVLLTPHIGGATGDVVRHHSDMVVADLRRWLRGERPANLLTPWPGAAAADR
jgi:phosphoglycerate dehydrogenase-like enzyme